MQKRKRIKLRYGKVTELARVCGVSDRTVTNALTWKRDTELLALIRKRAYELGFVRQF